MSKSLGNFFTVREVLKNYVPEVVRYFFLTSHYRSPLNYSDTQLDEARAALDGLYLAMREIPGDQGNGVKQDYVEKFRLAMDDDFNTPRAIAVLHDIAHAMNRESDKASDEAVSLLATLRYLGGILGLLQNKPEDFLKGQAASVGEGFSAGEIEALVKERNQARKDKNFARADEIRSLLSENGIVLEDSPQGTSWRRS